MKKLEYEYVAFAYHTDGTCLPCPNMDDIKTFDGYKLYKYDAEEAKKEEAAATWKKSSTTFGNVDGGGPFDIPPPGNDWIVSGFKAC